MSLESLQSRKAQQLARSGPERDIGGRHGNEEDRTSVLRTRRRQVMVTNYPQEVVTSAVGTSTVEPYAGRLFSRLWRRVQFALCSLHGHDPLLHYDENRIYLRCASCGHETPGWELDQRRPRVRF